MEDIKETLLKSSTGSHWQRIGPFHHYGIDLPLFSLRSKNSCGIGEFLDLLPMIDWCKQLRMDVIQLLPLNDSGQAPYPYGAVSSCALNPMYLSLASLPFLEELPELKKKLSSFTDLNQKQRLAYHEVQSHKILWLHEYIDQVGPKLTKMDSFANYVKENSWLDHYALFKVLTDLLGHNSWTTWPKELVKPTEKEFKELLAKYEKEILFYVALQYLCFYQMKAVKDYATTQNVFLKGDIPILISKDSADVWHHPHFFNLSLSAGAPPDMYIADGQDWGFPLFNWEAKKKTQYSWWKRRLGYAANFYDMFRIDHVVGLFRIWAVPPGKTPKEGHFDPPDEALWIPQGKEILEMMIACTSMLPIAEDLGTVPTSVRTCLLEFGIPGTKVMRWERYYDDNKSYIPIEKYSPVSMTTVSTHDSETLTQWWQHPESEAKAFAAYKKWEYLPHLLLSHRKEILWDSNHSASFFHINLLSEYLALFPELVWEKPEDERINVPGRDLPTNWTYRFRPTVEEIVSHAGLKTELEKIISYPRPPE